MNRDVCYGMDNGQETYLNVRPRENREQHLASRKTKLKPYLHLMGPLIFLKVVYLDSEDR